MCEGSRKIFLKFPIHSEPGINLSVFFSWFPVQVKIVQKDWLLSEVIYLETIFPSLKESKNRDFIFCLQLSL